MSTSHVFYGKYKINCLKMPHRHKHHKHHHGSETIEKTKVKHHHKHHRSKSSSSSSSTTEVERIKEHRHHHHHHSSDGSHLLKKPHDLYQVKQPSSSELMYKRGLSLYEDQGRPWCGQRMVIRNRKHMYQLN